jgi:hypothetical protein
MSKVFRSWAIVSTACFPNDWYLRSALAAVLWLASLRIDATIFARLIAASSKFELKSPMCFWETGKAQQ